MSMRSPLWQPTDIDRRLYYRKPERAQVRSVLTIAVAEWNSWRETDAEPTNRQNRHSCWKGYW